MLIKNSTANEIAKELTASGLFRLKSVQSLFFLELKGTDYVLFLGGNYEVLTDKIRGYWWTKDYMEPRGYPIDIATIYQSQSFEEVLPFFEREIQEKIIYYLDILK